MLLSSSGFCDNGDFLDEGFITALFSLEWLAGAFLHLHECHFHMVRNVIAKLKKYGLSFLTYCLCSAGDINRSNSIEEAAEGQPEELKHTIASSSLFTVLQ